MKTAKIRWALCQTVSDLYWGDNDMLSAASEASPNLNQVQVNARGLGSYNMSLSSECASERVLTFRIVYSNV